MGTTNRWMPFYIPDYLADTSHLTTVQHGAYVLLLLHYWRNGPLPDDDAQLAAIARADSKTWRVMMATVRRFFTSSDGRLHQKRMDAERQRWSELSEKRREAGKAGANAKHNGGNDPDKPGGKRLANAIANNAANEQQRHDFAAHSVNTPLPTSSKKDSKTPGTPPVGAREASGSTEPEAVGPKAAADVVVSMQKALRMKAYPPRAAIRSPADQAEAITPARPKPSHLTPEQLALVRGRRTG